VNRLILVSNRLPVTFSQEENGDLTVTKSVGGLATALREPHERSKGVWVGWPGPTDDLDEPTIARLDSRLAEMGAVPVHLTSEEVRRYYGTFSNAVLWPLFHYVTAPLPLRVDGWQEYRDANRKFADAVVANYRDGDLIWVHDYQLMLVPGMIRERIPDAKIGFFLHIPFPSSELFAVVPSREVLLQGILGADLVGFHTDSYRRHFHSATKRILGQRREGNVIQFGDRRVHTGVFPIGIDASGFEARAQEPAVIEAAAEILGDGSHKILLGIDRLDYTKGIPRRLLAFEELLTRWPEWRERVRLVQVAVPSRGEVKAYRRYRQEVDSLVGRINGEFATPLWVPVHHMFRSVDDVELSALYRAADVMLVTPIRDGMNLVAKEFAASRPDENGVLILSEFAGAAEQLDGAVSVNPYDIAGSAEAYHRALLMPREERWERMQKLRSSVFQYDVHRWVADFLACLADPSDEEICG
jgi:trehalose 6-phosphate synthase/phosphatase